MTDAIFARIEYTDGTHGTYTVREWDELWKEIGGRQVESIEAHKTTDEVMRNAGKKEKQPAGTAGAGREIPAQNFR